ncbi:hypothetical protein K458DRAFT_341694 [Lentithecium fluviatile CBS 122367]|uniref:Uncharacterized protein n=1 Tax=Lentithecium fluviatile CBS 122367 TaxID=1168545 RepID=A0A6G1IX39_9PLEO|nr:hypothetical protein K458DRAFT_341694 [Lentithecium fluviatile CBS 122367]
MDAKAIEALVSTADLIAATLDSAPDSWRDHLQAVRTITTSLELTDSFPDDIRKQWQLSLISVFQRVAFADADHGGVPDIANWCLRQALNLLQVYPEDVDLLTLIGQSWLLRAQKPLSSIHHTEQSSCSSGGSQGPPLSSSEEQRRIVKATIEAEDRLHAAEYVEARGILLPAIEYLKHAVDAAISQDKLSGTLLSLAAEAYMSLGNVSSARTNGQHFHEALVYLRRATEIPNFELPLHLQQYVSFGPHDGQLTDSDTWTNTDR